MRLPFLRRHGAIVAILVVAVAVRYVGIGFGLPNTNCRPDEEYILAMVFSLSGGVPIHAFDYPLFFMIVLTAILKTATWAGWLTGYLSGPGAMTALFTPERIRLLARGVSAAAGSAAVWLVFRSGTRLFGRAAGLLSAAFLALAFLHVRDSHFGVTDVSAGAMAMLAFLCAVRFWQNGRAADLAAAALIAGLATATKYQVGLILLPGLLVILGGRGDDGPLAARIRRAAMFLGLVCVGFAAGSPQAVLQWREVAAAVLGEAGHLSGGHGVMLGRGWEVHLTRTLRYGLGWPLLAAGLAGMLWLTVKDWRRGLFVAVFPLTYYLVLGSGYTVFARYMVPVLPFLCLTAGYAVAEAARLAAPHLHIADRPGWVAFAMAVCVLAPSAYSVACLDRLLTRTDNRCLAAAWIEQHYPRGASIAQLGEDAGTVVLIEPVGRWGHAYAFRPFDPAETDIVVLESSPRTPRPHDRAMLRAIEQRYVLAADFRATGYSPSNIYDRQDMFYLPLAGFEDVSRPGPNLAIYVRR